MSEILENKDQEEDRLKNFEELSTEAQPGFLREFQFCGIFSKWIPIMARPCVICGS
ncbi:MAG: hypothetical protein P8I97_10450 [Verrucomicrobiales bacterium]|jgi:hypothetical protein|nr:hypothetical protein [Verrucomicrobiales bacterium]